MKGVIKVCLIISISVIMLAVSCGATTADLDMSNDICLVLLPEAKENAAPVSSLIDSEYSTDASSWKCYFKVSNNRLYMDALFNTLAPSVQLNYVEGLIDDLSVWDGDRLVKQAIYNAVTTGIDSRLAASLPTIIDITTADLVAAYAWYVPWRSTVGMILGVLVLILTLLLVFSTILDLVYLGIPAITVFMDNSTGVLRHLLIISNDAKKVASEVAHGSATNVYLLYFKRRCVTILIISVCILYLISGKLGDVLGWFLNIADTAIS